MSCHGHAQIKTSHIDRFAKQSVEFTHFYAPPYCSPSGIFEELDHPVSVNAAGEVFEGRSFPGNDHLGVAVAIGTAEFGIEKGSSFSGGILRVESFVAHNIGSGLNRQREQE